MSNIKESFIDTTYSLAKSLHHVNIAKEYLQDIKRDTKGPVKDLFNGYIMRCDFILNNMRDRLNPKNREILKQELKDSFMIEAINDKLIHLDEQQRLQVETFIDELIKTSRT
jgi:hypothetical protein